MKRNGHRGVVWISLTALAVLLLAGCSTTAATIDGDLDSDSDVTEYDQESMANLFETIPAALSCSPTADACTQMQPVAGIFASYRKDYYFSQELYSEETEPPVDGGRFHIAGISAINGTVTDVFIDGQNVKDMLVEPLMEWYHVWPEKVQVGKPLWFAFHSRNPHWDSTNTGTIKIETDQGVALEGSFDVAITGQPLGYVTWDAAGEHLLIHLKNTETKAVAVQKILVNGMDVLASGVTCLPKQTIGPQEALLITVPWCTPPQLGAAWSVVVQFEQGPPSVGVGRVLKHFFPIEAWPSSEECPLPGVNDETNATLAKAGIDTFYIYWNGYNGCGYDREKLFFETLPARGDTFLLLGDDFPFENPPANALPNTDAILGFLTGDESDFHYYTEDGIPKASLKAANARSIWHHYPELTVYNGAMTNKHIGAFAGMTDVQGIDIYNAACAPHITEVGDHPSLRAPYDYLVNARNNHMPWPTWLYSQGVGNWYNHADPQEILIQAFSVMVAGGKGLMWFQAKHSLALETPDTWQAMSDAGWMFRGVRPYLLTGDLTGMVASEDTILVDMIRSPDALIIPVLNMAYIEEPTDDSCIIYGIGAGPEPHWILAEHEVSFTVQVPSDMTVNDLFEVTVEGPVDVHWPVEVDGDKVIFHSVPLSNDEPVRLVVLGRNASVRKTVADEMAIKETLDSGTKR